MKRSATISITLVAAAAASVLACSPEPEAAARHCVDANDVVVPDSLCVRAVATGDTLPTPVRDSLDRQRRSGGGIGFIPLFLGYRYLYGGSAAGLGTRVNGGYYTPQRGVSYRSGARGNVSRGGFGRTGGIRGGGYS